MADQQKKSCTESADLYEDLLKCPGAKRLPGTGRKVYLAPRRWITQLAKPQLEKAASMKDYLVIKESHTMAADKKFTENGFPSFMNIDPFLHVNLG